MDMSLVCRDIGVRFVSGLSVNSQGFLQEYTLSGKECEFNKTDFQTQVKFAVLGNLGTSTILCIHYVEGVLPHSLYPPNFTFEG